MIDVLCLSDCCADLIFQNLPSLPAKGTEVYGQSFCVHAGGGANTPMALAKLGCHTAYAAALGKDALGGIVLKEITDCGVDTRYLKICEDWKTWVSAVLVADDERSFVSYAGSSISYSDPWLHEAIKNAQHVHTYLYYAQQYPEIAARCQESNTTLSMDLAFDPALRLEDIAPVLHQADLITPNELEACMLTGTRTPRQALEKMVDICPGTVITLGAEGCLAMVSGSVYHVMPPVVKVANTNGAGDLFNAGFLYARGQHMPIEEQLRYACAAGAVAVTCESCACDVFSLDSVRAMAEQTHIDILS